MFDLDKLSQGLQCKACNSPLGDDPSDPELCRVCLEVVADYNSDLEIEEGEE